MSTNFPVKFDIPQAVAPYGRPPERRTLRPTKYSGEGFMVTLLMVKV
jgi:hypothetical protein